MLKERIVTALILIPLVLGALFFAPDWLWKLIIVIAAGIAAWEWAQLAGIKNCRVKTFYTLAVGVGVVAGLEYVQPLVLKFFIVLQLAVVLLAVVAYQVRAGRGGITPLLAGFLGFVFIASFSWAIVWLREANTVGAIWLLFALAAIWLMDTGAYFAGRAFGKHKLANYVSPGKTWEGVAGGVVAVLIGAGLVAYFAGLPTQAPLPIQLAALGLIALLSVFGDLFESLLKRQVGVKDSGTIFPGHGGMLDRIDSLLIAVPLFWVLWLGLDWTLL